MPEKKDCFVIGPIGADNSETRRRSERVIEDVIKPAARRCGYRPVPARTVTRPGLISTEVFRQVVSAPLVIADLTSGNPNVFYELALRHATTKPLIQLAGKDQEIPFNIKDTRVVWFDIDDVESRRNAIEEIVKEIRHMEQNPVPLETPISATGAIPWVPFPQGEDSQPVPSPTGEAINDQTPDGGENHQPVSPPVEEPIEKIEKILQALPQPEAIQVISKYIRELTEDPSVHLLASPFQDLGSAIALVNNVPEGGHISATSSVHYEEDADAQDGYRSAVNLALERKVTYRKVICASVDLWPERKDTWMEEFRGKAELIKAGKIRPDAFQLLHHPSPMYVDVLISQDSLHECQSMVIGFAAVGGKHGGFRTSDKRIVKEWLDVYLEARIIAEAKEHTDAVLEGKKECDCLIFLNLLEEARIAAAPPPQPAEPKSHTSRKRRRKRT